MAGLYPDVPGRRMAWDADGSVAVYAPQSGSALIEFTGVQTAELNDEDNTGAGVTTSGFYAIIFPELRDIAGFFVSMATVNRIGLVETSANTTNGRDGTWATISTNPVVPDSVYDNYRTGIITAASVGVRAIRFNRSGQPEDAQTCGAIHVYGEISAGQTPDKLVFIDVATGLEFVLPIDWGDVPRGTIHEKTIRVTNQSAGLTANDITLSFEDLYLGSSSWYTIKETAGAFASTLAIDKINPGITYPTAPDLITIRKTVPDDEQLGLHAARLKLPKPDSWTALVWEADLSGTATITATLSVT